MPNTLSWSRARAAFAIALVFAAPVLTVLFVIAYTVDIPYLDEWEMTPLVLKLATGGFHFGDFWSPHNEHRIVVPKLILLALASLGGWNILRETLFSVAVALSFLGLTIVAIRNVTPERVVPVVTLMSLTTFGLSQAENWLWGFEIAWFLLNVALFAALLLLDAPHRRGSFLGALFCASIATVCGAAGMVAWIGGFFVLAASSKPNRTRLIVWSIASFVLVISYFSNFSTSLYRPPEAHGLAFFTTLGAYTLTYLGSPLARSFGAEVALLAGALLVVAFFAACARLRIRSIQRGVLPFIALGVCSIGIAIETAIGRSGYGLEHALGGRFCTESSLLIVALIGITAHLPGIVPRRNAILGSAAIASLIIVQTLAGFREGSDASVRLYGAGFALTHLDIASDRELQALFPAAGAMRIFASELRVAGEGPFYGLRTVSVMTTDRDAPTAIAPKR